MNRVVVVGAGPAGSSLAIRLARRGVAVDLVDQCQFPRPKPCGEGLMPKALADLEELGVLGRVRARGTSFAGIAYVSGSRRAEARFPRGGADHDQGLGVPRSDLDRALVEQAGQTPGVTLHLGTRVNGFRLRDGRVRAVCTDRGELPCTALVGADGRHSLVRRRAGLDAPAPARSRSALVASLEVEGPLPEVVEVHLLDRRECYLTPVGGGQVQVALCLEKSASKEIGGDPEGALEAALASPSLVGLASRSRRVGPVQAVGRLSVGARKPADQGIFLAGDAAGFLDPVTGEGVSLALGDTRVLAPLLAELAGGAELSEIQRRYARDFAPPRRQVAFLTHLVLALVRFPSVAHFVVGRLARRPALFRRLVAVAAGLGEFHDLRLREAAAVLVP